MIRKQLYIDPHQDAALKRKARELGLSEAELVRRALDAVLTEIPQVMPARPSVLQALLEDAQALCPSRTPRPKGTCTNVTMPNAQIWAVVKLKQVPVILSEDFNSGGMLEGVHFLNPFDAGLNLASL